MPGRKSPVGTTEKKGARRKSGIKLFDNSEWTRIKNGFSKKYRENKRKRNKAAEDKRYREAVYRDLEKGNG